MPFQAKTYTCGDTGGVRKLVNLAPPWIDVSLPANGIPNGSQSLLLDIEVDPNNGDKVFTVGEGYCSSLAVNWYGIAVTANGGALWTVPGGNYQNVVNNPGCYHKWIEISIVDSNTIFVCGIVDPITRKGTVCKSTDGGATFNMCGPLPSTVDQMDVTSIHFITPLIGVVGLNDYACKTTDGGATWTVCNGSSSFTSSGYPMGPITGIFLSAAEDNMMVVGLPRVLRAADPSPNAGMINGSWGPTVTANNNSFVHLSRFSDQVIYVSGIKDSIVETQDGGGSWSACPYSIGGLPSTGPSRIAAHFYKLNVSVYEGFFSGNATIYNSLNGACVPPSPTTNDETSPYGVQAVWTWYHEGAQTTCYLLTECSSGATIITDTDLSANVGQVISINGIQGCWQVSVNVDCSNASTITVANSYVDCNECYPSCYLLTDCAGGSNPITILTDTDLSAYLNLTVQLSQYPGVCWAVTKSPTCTGATPLTSTITAQFANCASCLQKCYKLIDCTGLNPDVITSTDLSAYIGKIIKIKGCPDTCWTVLASDTCTGSKVIAFDSFYSSCSACLAVVIPDIVLKQRSIYPNYGNSDGNCSLEYIERVNCNFAEQTYRKMINKRYGVESCEEDMYIKYLVKKHLLDLDLLKDPNACKTAECCAPCSVTASLVVSYPISCPAPTDVTTEFTVPVNCPAPEDVEPEFKF